jgi:hypothetical protein|nr:hypothetical protein [Kofleriaceae bacterium]
MLKPILFAAVVAAVAACTPPMSYVANVHYDGGTLVQDKCEFSAHGHPTTDCHSEPVEGAPVAYDPPDPAELAAAGRAANQPRAQRPAPDDAAVAHALASRGVHDAIELCRGQYAPGLAAFTFTLVVAPSGKIVVTPHDTQASQDFLDCASSAVRGANLTAFDGKPVTFEQQLAL